MTLSLIYSRINWAALFFFNQRFVKMKFGAETGSASRADSQDRWLIFGDIILVYKKLNFSFLTKT